jgi:hypothetical protein
MRNLVHHRFWRSAAVAPEFDYISQVFADYVDVREGRKPLLIVSAGKSDAAEGSPYPYEARDAIIDAISEGVLGVTQERAREIRSGLQLKLGLLLGYSAAECIEFINSALGQTCPCDCCGSEFTVIAQKTDGNPSRFVEYAYQY